MEDVFLEPVPVLCVTAPEGLEGVQRVWEELESRIPSLRGRRFYGVFHPPTGSYRACVATQPGDDARGLMLELWTIPGGRYARRRMLDWEEHVGEIGRVFEEMAQERAADPQRPSIEFYRSQKELILLLPVKGG